MKKSIANIAAITLAIIPAIANAEPSEPVSFRHSGQLYTYTTEQVGETRVLRGEAGAGRDPFVLTVGKSWVSGTVNGSPVSFSLKSVKRIRGIVTVDQLAAR